jgi:serine/threonine protein kinase
MGAYRAVKIVYRCNFGNDRPFEREFRGIQKFEPISRMHDSQVDILHIGRNHDYFYYVMELADDAGPERPERSDGVLECRSNGHKGFSGLPNTPPLDQSTNPVIQQSISPALHHSPSAYVPHTLKLDLSRRGRLPVAECVDIGIRLATALAHLHQNGLVHRDVKPSNVIFIAGIPKLADIGLVTGVAGHAPG